MGEKGRWRSTLSGKIADSVRGKKTIESQCEDYTISPVVRQTLQHWGSVFCYTIVLPFFSFLLVMSLSVSLLSIYCRLLAFYDMT
jgi:hypothetical protein